IHWGQNENPPLSGLCQLTTAADMALPLLPPLGAMYGRRPRCKGMWAYDKALKLTAVLSGPNAPQGEEAQAIMREMWRFRDVDQRYASAAAPYVHPRLAAIQHDYRSEDGSAIRPVLIISGGPVDLHNADEPEHASKAGAGKGDTHH